MAERWYSLGNNIEEEGINDLTGKAVAISRDGDTQPQHTTHLWTTKMENPSALVDMGA